MRIILQQNVSAVGDQGFLYTKITTLVLLQLQSGYMTFIKHGGLTRLRDRLVSDTRNVITNK